MSDYLNLSVDANDADLISSIDELPLWSAPFGLRLLDAITMKRNCTILDVGCGTGFPLIELAQRFGSTSRVYGIDPWEKALERVALKLKTLNITNTTIQPGVAEKLPFADSFFDLIVSNNGLNNVQDLEASFAECSRVCKPGGEFAISFNLAGSMIEFYSILEAVLKEEQLPESIVKMKKHIYEKRRPVYEITSLLSKNNFSDVLVFDDVFYLRFADGTTMLNHTFISYWFMDSWKKLIPDEKLEKVFRRVEERLNEIAGRTGEIRLTIPFVVILSKHLDPSGR